MAPAVEMQSLNHWTTKEVPYCHLMDEETGIYSPRQMVLRLQGASDHLEGCENKLLGPQSF